MKPSHRRRGAPEARYALCPAREQRVNVVLVDCRTCGDRAAYINMQEAFAPCVLCSSPVAVIGRTNRVREAVAWVFRGIRLEDS